MFSLTASAQQSVNDFVGDSHLIVVGTHTTAQSARLEYAISSMNLLLGPFGLRMSHLARTFDTFRFTITELGFGDKIPASKQVLRRLDSHMRALVELAIDLPPLCRQFTEILQSNLQELAFPLSQATSSSTPVSQTLRILDHSMCHNLEKCRFNINAMILICCSEDASSWKDIVEDLYYNWLSYLMTIDDDAHDLRRLLHVMQSVAANIPDGIPYVHTIPLCSLKLTRPQVLIFRPLHSVPYVTIYLQSGISGI